MRKSIVRSKSPRSAKWYGPARPRNQRPNDDLVKTTAYFKYTRSRPDRARIKDEWIKRAIDDPINEQIQSDGRVRRWTWVPEEGKFLRVVLMGDEETVHNAFFDRNFKDRSGG